MHVYIVLGMVKETQTPYDNIGFVYGLTHSTPIADRGKIAQFLNVAEWFLDVVRDGLEKNDKRQFEDALHLTMEQMYCKYSLY